jgi:hypothetical protein
MYHQQTYHKRMAKGNSPGKKRIIEEETLEH